MGQLVERNKAIESKKRWSFVGVGLAGVATGVGLTWILGVPLLGVGIYLGIDWFRFRAKHGMRF